MREYLKLLRVHHYIKNVLVLAPLACSGLFFHWQKLRDGVGAFFAFCMVSSIVYIINDIKDRDKDRNHPTKKNRPIASGAVTIKTGMFIIVTLAVLVSLLSFILHKGNAAILLLVYIAINIAYSFWLKRIPIIDVTVLVSGFLIRMIYGSIITEISISNWLYLTVMALSFYFALGKRRNEIKQVETDETRSVLSAYPFSFLDKNMGMFLTLANTFYALWSMDTNTISMYKNKNLILTVPIIFLITMKYSFDIEGTSDGDPVEVLLHDKILLCLCAIYIITMFIILYL
ncbi:MAG: decaprenyl-phosphate phosphoribosyltransferase [Clostridia bacterium]|nr:decaprenyl-phosphate phosphoribosyltransferase [Clostridia bacterium]